MIPKINFVTLFIFSIANISYSDGIENINLNSIRDSSIVISGNWGNNPGEFGLERIKEMGDAPAGPTCFVLDGVGNILVGDRVNNRIQKFDSNGNFVKSFTLVVENNTDTVEVTDIACDSQGRIFVADCKKRRIVVFKSDGQLLKKIPLDYLISQFDELRINGNDQILIVDHRVERQFQISADGRIIDSFSNVVFVEKDEIFRISNKGSGIGHFIITRNTKNREKIADMQFKVNVNVSDYLFAGIDGHEHIYVVGVPFEPNYEIVLAFDSNGELKGKFKRNYRFWTVDKRCYFVDKAGSFYVMNLSEEKFWITKYLLNR